MSGPSETQAESEGIPAADAHPPASDWSPGSEAMPAMAAEAGHAIPASADTSLESSRGAVPESALESEDDLLRTLDAMVQSSAQDNPVTAGTGDLPLPSGVREGENAAVLAEAAAYRGLGDGGYSGEAENTGTPEEWTALAALGALDGDAISDLASWLEKALPEEREIYVRRIRLRQILSYALIQDPPPPSLRESVAQAAGENGGRHPGRIYPHGRTPLFQAIAAKMGWPQTRLLGCLALLGFILAGLGGGLAWKAHGQLRFSVQAAAQSEASRHEAEIARRLAEKRFRLLSSSDLRVTGMQAKSSEASSKKAQAAHVIWSPYGRQALLWVKGLSNPPEGREYGLWVSSGARQFAALRFEKASGGEDGVFFEVPELQQGRPRPIQAFYLVLQPRGARDPSAGERQFTGSAYY